MVHDMETLTNCPRCSKQANYDAASKELHCDHCMTALEGYELPDLTDEEFDNLSCLEQSHYEHEQDLRNEVRFDHLLLDLNSPDQPITQTDFYKWIDSKGVNNYFLDLPAYLNSLGRMHNEKAADSTINMLRIIHKHHGEVHAKANCPQCKGAV